MIIKHRVNSIQEITTLPGNFGVEIDIRSSLDDLVLEHDPFKKGDKFEDWLDYFNHKTLILNVKEDGLEDEIISLLESRNITDYFFLDQPFPTQRKMMLRGQPIAQRLSEFENPLNLEALSTRWVWLDSFTGDWTYLQNHANYLKDGNFQTCLVSPELQGRKSDEEQVQILEILKLSGINLSAVCTKFPELWKSTVG